MYKFIHKIRGKSKAARRLAALSISLGITGIFAFFWALSYAEYSDRILNSKDNGNLSKATEIWNQMSTKIGESYDNFAATNKALGKKNAKETSQDPAVSISQGNASDTPFYADYGEVEGVSATSKGTKSDALNTNTESSNDKATTSTQDLIQ